MRVFTGYRTNLFLSSLKSRGFTGSIKRALDKRDYARRGLPTHVEIEITNRCNLSCPYCAASRDLISDKGRDMKLEEFTKIISDIVSEERYSPTIQLAFRGEPLLNKDATAMIGYARKKGLFVVISTNGLLIDEEAARKIVASGLNHIVISADGATKETYEAMRRGGRFEKLLKAIELLVGEKRRTGSVWPFIEMQCVIMRKTESEISDFRKLAARLGADGVKFKTYKLTCLGRQDKAAADLEGYLPKDAGYSRYKKENGRLVPKERAVRCSWGHDCLIYSDGDMGPCCGDYDKRHVAGNVLQENFWNIWTSDVAKSLRRKAGSRSLDICEGCS